MDELWFWKENEIGYKSILELVADTYRTYLLVKNSDIVKDLTYGRAMVEIDSLQFKEHFYEKFTNNRAEWKIISDYTSLFVGHPIKREYPLDPKFPFYLDLELSY